MKRIITAAASAFVAMIGIASTSHAETVLSVAQTSYDYQNHPICSAVRMNSAVYGSLPADACALGTQGSYGPDRIIKNTYDAAGQVTEADQAYGTSVQRAYARYTYTNNGLKQTEMDANGNKTMYVYDGFDRLSQVQYPSTTAGSGGINTADYEQFGYDNNSNKTSWRRRNGKSINYSYDNLNRELTRSVSDGSVQTVYSGYDALGHLLYARYGSTSGAGVSNAYDGLGKLSSTTDMNGRSIWYGYNQASARIQTVFPDGSNFDYYTVDALNRISVGYAAIGTTYTPVFAQGFDDLGRRIWLNHGQAPAIQTGYGYNGLDQLTSMAQYVNGSNSPASNVAWTFTYSPAGQLASTSASSTLYDYKETASTTVNNTYDGLNRDAGIAALSGGYDANGNLGNDGSRLFTYDVYNRLTGIGTTAYPGNPPYLTLTYDPLGRLSSQTYYGTTTTFLYDGTNLIGEYDGSGAMAERYMHGDGTDEPLVWFHGSGISASSQRFFVQDWHGSVIGWADAWGNLGDLYRYGPYGEPKNAANSTSFTGARFRYTGQTVIPEASLYYYKARVYDPIMGRFLQTDPIGSASDLNRYAYTGGDPVNGSDPTGMYWYDCTATAPPEGKDSEGNPIITIVAQRSCYAPEFATSASNRGDDPVEVTMVGARSPSTSRSEYLERCLKAAEDYAEAQRKFQEAMDEVQSDSAEGNAEDQAAADNANSDDPHADGPNPIELWLIHQHAKELDKAKKKLDMAKLQYEIAKTVGDCAALR